VSGNPVRPHAPDHLQEPAVGVDHLVMNTMACRAVAQAGLCAATASLDHEADWPLLQVAGWLTTAADLVIESGLRETELS
jgi:hypothetical protein